MVKTGRTIPKEEQEIIVLDHITQIENPIYLNKKVEVEAIVSSTSYSYAVPKIVEASWYEKDVGVRYATEHIPITSSINMKIVGSTSSGKHTILKMLFPDSKKATFTDKEYRTVYTLRVRPQIFSLEEKGDKLVDERGFEYKSYRIYVVSDEHITFPASSLVRLRGFPLPDPKTQQITLLISEIEFPDSVGNFDKDKINELAEVYAPLSFNERMNWVLNNFEEYSRIVGRRNIATAAIIGVYSPLYMTINGETQRGWANILILGDTTTAKTKTVRELLKLVNTGTLITAETATTVGLTGAAVQIGKEGWSIDWGFLVLNDLGLLAVDGAHKLRKSDWSALAEAERKGIITQVKAAKGTAYSRTRQIKIANPVDPDSIRRETKNLDEFYQAATAAGTFLDLMSVARLDICVFADSSDVKAEDINKKFLGVYDKKLHHLEEVRKWVWSVNPTTHFTPEAEDYLLSIATELYNKFFYKKIPLASIDLKWKLGIMSAAVAALTLSTIDYSTIVIEKEHIEWVKNFIEKEYMNVGLHTLAERARHEIATEESVSETIQIICLTISEANPDKAKEILEWIAIRGRFIKAEMKTTFSLSDNNQLRPLITYLSNNELIKQGKGYYATPKLNQVCKVLETLDLSDVPIFLPDDVEPLPDVHDKLKQGKIDSGGIPSSPDNQEKRDTAKNLGYASFIFLDAGGDFLEEEDVLRELKSNHDINAEEGRELIGALMDRKIIYESEDRPYSYAATGERQND